MTDREIPCVLGMTVEDAKAKLAPFGINELRVRLRGFVNLETAEYRQDRLIVYINDDGVIDSVVGVG